MCVQSQISFTKHLILTARGSRWRDALLVMFTVYIDDSGTDPKQPIAIAAGIILPALEIESFDAAWKALREDEFISEFHSSECAASQAGTDFESWSSQRKKRLFWRVREFIKQHAVSAFSFAINKSEYDQYVTGELREVGGRFHYTWAIRHLIANLDAWALNRGVSEPFEYVFDWMGESKRNESKKEIEIVMAQAESMRPGFYEGHYSFRKRKDHPGLQCVDLLAWSSYQFMRSAFLKTACHHLAWESFWDFDGYKDKKWLFAVTQRPDDVKDWAEREIADERSQARRKGWLEAHKQKR